MTTGVGAVDSAPSLTIEDLAARTGLTIRNVRAYRSRGLLTPPRRVGRRGYYGVEHVRRIARIRRLQEAGFNLAAIRALLPREDDDDDGVLRQQAFTAWLHEEPVVVSLDILEETFGRYDDELTAEASRLGLVTRLDGRRMLVTSPTLLEVAGQLTAFGLSRRELMEIHTAVFRQTRALAAMFVELCLTHAWSPYAGEGYPRERWDEVRERARRLQPLAGEVLLVSFALQMRRAAAAALDVDSPTGVPGISTAPGVSEPRR